MNMIKSVYDRFSVSRNDSDFIELAALLSDKEKYKTLLVLYSRYSPRHLLIYAYIANAYQKTGNLHRARRLYYKLARRLDPKYWESLAFCLRGQKCYFLSSFAYVYGAARMKRPALIRNALYNLLIYLGGGRTG